VSPKQAEELVQEASRWWTTEIVDVKPGEIAFRGYPIQELIGRVRFPDMIWLLLRGELPTHGQANLLEAALVSGVDHGPHAPSIAISRMAMTCGVELNGAMASAINVLDEIHGGAGQGCMQIYRDIAARMDAGTDLAAATEAALAAFFATGEKIVPGFGHRWHPVDPRTPRLLGIVDEAVGAGLIGGRFARIGRQVEAALQARKGKLLPMNVDGVTAVIFCELGFEPELGRGLFILSRSVGILAHAWEQRQQGGRIKGPMPKGIPFTYAGPARRKIGEG
jgi:citrate synthase